MLFLSTRHIHCNISSLSDNLDNFKTQRLNSIHYNAVDFRKDSTQSYQQVTNAFGKQKIMKFFNASFGELRKSTMLEELPRRAGLCVQQPG